MRDSTRYKWTGGPCDQMEVVDHFAALAMQSLIAKGTSDYDIGEAAYRIAEKMVYARRKWQEKKTVYAGSSKVGPCYRLEFEREK